MIVPTSTRLAWHVTHDMFASVIGDDECGTSRSVDARRSSTGSGSPDGVVECEAGRKTLERNCSYEEVHGCMHRHERTYSKTAEYAIKPGRIGTNRPPCHGSIEGRFGALLLQVSQL